MAKRIIRNKVQKTPQSLARQMRSILHREAEKKVAVVGGSATSITTAGTVINLSNGIAQGDEFYQRSGDKITILHQQLKTRFVALTTSQTCRFILFVDRFNQGTTPVVLDVLSTANYISTYAQLDVIQQRRFGIIRDWTVDCSIAGRDIVSNTKFINGDYTVYFNGSTFVASANGKGALFLMVIGSAATGIYDHNWEASYIDM